MRKRAEVGAPETCTPVVSLSAPATASDLELLRTFEPVLRFTKGENFFPTAVENYLSQAALWVRQPDGAERQLVARGELDIDRLIEPREHPAGSTEFLRFTEQLGVADSARVLTEVARMRREAGEKFHPGIGRLARGGFIPRLFDAVFTVLLIARGRIPGIAAAAAKMEYQRAFDQDERYVYYGRVARQAGWTILQYWFFYSYNDWRSGFSGANDHEADWENVLLYLYEENGRLHLEWAGYASHDFHGDQLRRRCDDIEGFHLLDGHPVVWVGAGSHASYFQPGEYQAAITLPLPTWIRFLARAFSYVWTQVLGQAGRERDPARIPFVDFARGDGKRIGPGQDAEWNPVVIHEQTPWVGGYQGLWGLFLPDSATGENAPAGPMYNPDSSPRRSWYDPLAFAGLDKEPPPPAAIEIIERDVCGIETRQRELVRLIAQKDGELQALGVEFAAIEASPHLRDRRDILLGQIAVLREDVSGLRRETWENTAILGALTERLRRLQQGQKCDARAHLVTPIQPVTFREIRFNRLAEAWAALSLSLILLGVVGLLVFAQSYLWVGLVIMVGALLFIESIVRRHYSRTITAIAAVLAVVSAVILLLRYWLWVIVTVLVGLALFLLVQKLRELAR